MSAQHSIPRRQQLSTSHPKPVEPLVRRMLAHARVHCRVADLFRIGFGLIWAVDAGFKWQSGFRQGFMGMVMQQGQGEPGWMHFWFRFWIDLQHPDAMFWAYLVAVVETVIAVALIFGFARKYLYIIGALFSLTIWGTAEGFGGPYSGASTDIGAAVMYAVVFAGLLAFNYEGGPSRFSVDYLIEQRVSWWHRIAEVGHNSHTGERLHRPPVTTIAAPAVDEHTPISPSAAGAPTPIAGPVADALLVTEQAQHNAIRPDVDTTPASRAHSGRIAVAALLLLAAAGWHGRDRP